MQSPKTPNHMHVSPVKQHIMQQQQHHDDNNSSSSDQLSSVHGAQTPAYGRCPLIPCMPDLNRYVSKMVLVFRVPKAPYSLCSHSKEQSKAVGRARTRVHM
jgi:hypothetical protein